MVPVPLPGMRSARQGGAVGQVGELMPRQLGLLTSKRPIAEMQ
jgi:hypothetical protein